MTDVVVAAQSEYAQKFYMPAVKNGQLMHDFLPEVQQASELGFWRKVYLNPNGTASAGAVNTFQIPSRGTLISDMYLEISLGATSGGNYSTLMAWNIVQNILISHGGNTLAQYDYMPFIEYLCTVWNNEIKSQFQTIAGGAASGSATVVYAPVGAYWTNWKHVGHEGEFQTPLPLLASSTPIQVDVQLRSIANILAAGGSGGSLSSMRLIYYEFVIPSGKQQEIISIVKNSPEYRFFGYDWQTISQSTIATGTLTTIDLSAFQGDLKEIIYPLKLASDIDTAHNYFINKVYTNASLKVDGTEIYLFNQTNEMKIDQLIFNQAGVGTDSTNGLAPVVNFSKRRDSFVWDGSLNSNAYKKFTIDLTHALGANAYVFPLATFYRYLIFRNGLFERVK
jgi:hypothetical protein